MQQNDSSTHTDSSLRATAEMVKLYEEVVAAHPIKPLKCIPASAEASRLVKVPEPVAADAASLRVAVYSPTTVSLVMDSLSEGAADQRDALKPILKSMLRSDGKRRLVTINDVSCISALRDRFPNFSDAIQMIEGAVALAARTPQKVLHFPPMLLVGDPGLGKTMFAEAVAQALGTTMSKASFAQMTSGWVLGGLDLSWRGGKTGRVFDTLVRGDVANPLIMCDEIDKARADGQFDPIGPLYDLLEAQSARAFHDEAVPIPLDASNIIWMLTANSLSTIPEPIVSRCEVVTVRMPTGVDAVKVANSVYASLRIKVPGASTFPEVLPEDMVERLADQPPRELMRTLEKAMRAAALRGSDELSVMDVPAPQRKQRVGFCA